MPGDKKLDIRNNFGVLSEAYDAVRRGYPDEVYEYVQSLTREKNPLTLDLGCGTGISTRELKAHGFNVIGVDKDATMIEIAKKRSEGIEYVIAPVTDLTFPDESFDVITAFTSFHWFANEENGTKIKKLLKPGGVFFAALKDGRIDERLKGIQKRSSEIIRKYVQGDYRSTRDYDPEEVLKQCQFKNIVEKDFSFDEWYTLEDALKFVQTLSYWNLVRTEDRPAMLAELRELYASRLIDGLWLKPRLVTTIAGYK